MMTPEKAGEVLSPIRSQATADLSIRLRSEGGMNSACDQPTGENFASFRICCNCERE